MRMTVVCIAVAVCTAFAVVVAQTTYIIPTPTVIGVVSNVLVTPDDQIYMTTQSGSIYPLSANLTINGPAEIPSGSILATDPSNIVWVINGGGFSAIQLRGNWNTPITIPRPTNCVQIADAIIDSAGALIIGCSGVQNNQPPVVRKYGGMSNSTVVSTFYAPPIGSPYQYEQFGALAVDNQNRVYVVFQGNTYTNTTYQLLLLTGNGSSATSLINFGTAYCQSFAVDANLGVIYVILTSNFIIGVSPVRLYTLNGAFISTSTALSASSLVVDTVSNIYLVGATLSNGTDPAAVREFSQNGTLIAQSTFFAGYSGFTTDSNGALWACDVAYARVIRLDSNGDVTLSYNLNPLNDIYLISIVGTPNTTVVTVDTNSSLLLMNSNKIIVIDATNGALIRTIVMPNTYFQNPIVDGNGNIYATFTKTIGMNATYGTMQFDSNGNYVTTSSLSVYSAAVDNFGFFYSFTGCSQYGTNPAVNTFAVSSLSRGQITTFSLNLPGSCQGGVAMKFRNGLLYLGLPTMQVVVVVLNPQTSTQTVIQTITITSTASGSLQSMAIDNRGTIYATDGVSIYVYLNNTVSSSSSTGVSPSSLVSSSSLSSLLSSSSLSTFVTSPAAHSASSSSISATTAAFTPVYFAIQSPPTIITSEFSNALVEDLLALLEPYHPAAGVLLSYIGLIVSDTAIIIEVYVSGSANAALAIVLVSLLKSGPTLSVSQVTVVANTASLTAPILSPQTPPSSSDDSSNDNLAIGLAVGIGGGCIISTLLVLYFIYCLAAKRGDVEHPHPQKDIEMNNPSSPPLTANTTTKGL